MATTDQHEPIDPVRPEDGCPKCGQRECDELVWLDDEQVQCQSCKTIYRPRERNDAGR